MEGADGEEGIATDRRISMDVSGSILDLDMPITHKGMRATKESHYFQSIMRATVDDMYSCFPKRSQAILLLNISDRWALQSQSIIFIIYQTSRALQLCPHVGSINEHQSQIAIGSLFPMVTTFQTS
jgi:hypothetical protein